MLKKLFFRGMYSPDFESEEDELSANSNSNTHSYTDDPENEGEKFANFLEYDEDAVESEESGGRGSTDFMGVPEASGRSRLTRQNTFTVEEGEEYIPPANRTRPVTASKRYVCDSLLIFLKLVDFILGFASHPIILRVPLL